MSAGRRVLAATLRYPPYVAGGYELLTRDAVEGLRARGHAVEVLTGRGRDLDGAPGVHATLLPDLDSPEAGFRHSFESSNAERARLHVLRGANVAATRRALRTSRAELLAFFNLGLVSLAPVLAARLEGVPTVGYVSDPWPENHWVRQWREDVAARGGERPLALALLESGWRAFRSCVGLGRLLVPSEYLRARLVADGVDAESLRVVPLGVPPALEARAVDAAPRPRAAGERLVVVCASMHWEGKGQHVLLEAAARAVEEGADLELRLAGGGADEAYAARLERLADDPRLAGRVRFEGLLDEETLADLLGAGHVLAFPSTWGEPFPLASLEGMAHGLALVTSDAGGTPEQVEDGASGLVVPAGDPAALAGALARLAADDGGRLALARAGQERVRARYTQARFVDGVELEVRRAMGERVA